MEASICTCMHAKSLQPCWTLCNPMDHSPPGSFIYGILQTRYWNGLPCPPPRDIPDQRSYWCLLCIHAMAGRFLPLVPPGKPLTCAGDVKCLLRILKDFEKS